MAEPSAATKADAELDRSSATFKASHLHALEPFIRRSYDDIVHWSTSGLIIEPVAAGGCVLVATDGRLLAALHDPDARATRAMRLTIPDEVFKSVAPPAPIAMTAEGESFDIPLPEWAQPGSVFAWRLSLMVFPKMHLPGEAAEDSPLLSDTKAEHGNVYEGGYRIHAEPPALGWRKLFAAPREGGGETFCVFPQSFAAFERISRLLEAGLTVRSAEPQSPLILTAPGSTAFVGAVMPWKPDHEDSGLPEWARASDSAERRP